MRPQELCPVKYSSATCNQHSSFTGTEVFVGKKAETTCIAYRAKLFAVILGQRTVARILDDPQTMLRGHLEYSIHVTGKTCIVHHDNRFCPVCDQTLDIPWIDSQIRVTDYIGKNRLGTNIPHCIYGCNKGK